MEELSLLQTAISYLASAPDWVEAILAMVVAATAVTALTPTKLDEKYLGKATTALNWLLTILNTVAGNVGKNKNADG